MFCMEYDVVWRWKVDSTNEQKKELEAFKIVDMEKNQKKHLDREDRRCVMKKIDKQHCRQ